MAPLRSPPLSVPPGQAWDWTSFGPFPDRPGLPGFPDLDLPSTGEALGYAQDAWSIIPYKQKGAILTAALLVARRHPIVAGATLGIAAVQAGRALGIPERVSGSGEAARRRLLPETVTPVTGTGPEPEPPPTVPEAVLERTRAGWRWVKRRAKEELEQTFPSGPIPGGEPFQ